MNYVFYDDFRELKKESDKNEVRVAEYFRRRGGYVERIPEDKRKRPDWYIVIGNTEFLCEVKTISSARRGEQAEHDFDKEFRIPVSQHFQQNRLKGIPCIINIHIDNMITPKEELIREFIDWLDIRVTMLYQKITNFTDNHHNERHQSRDYHAFFTMPGDKTHLKRRISVHFSFQNTLSGIKIFTPSYGGLNIRPIEDRITKAVEQLDEESRIRNKSSLPRMAMVSIRDGIDPLEWVNLLPKIKSLLERHKTLSTIGFFRWIPLSGDIFCPWVLSFAVFHNRHSDEKLKLPPHVFDDQISVQETP